MEVVILDRRRNTDHNAPPIDGAYRKSFVSHQVCKFKSHWVKEEFLKLEPAWFDIGKNHVESHLELSRDVDCTEWCISIKTPQELFNLINEGQNGMYGCELYVGEYTYDNTIPVIKLYSNL